MRRLTKSNNDKIFDGVLGGIAEYMGIDSTIVRVGFIFLTFFTVAFPGIVVYIILAIVMPSASRSRRNDDESRSSADRREHPYAANYSYQRASDDRARTRKEVEKVDEDDWSDF